MSKQRMRTESGIGGYFFAVEPLAFTSEEENGSTIATEMLKYLHYSDILLHFLKK